MTQIHLTAMCAVAGLALAGCATKQDAPVIETVRTVEVKTPVSRTCVPATLGAAPEYPDTNQALKAAKDAAERYLLVFAGRQLRSARIVELETVIEGCK